MQTYSDLKEKYRAERMSAAALTTYGGGGNATVFTPLSVDEFVDLYAALKRINVTPFILGGGSNVIISDGELKTPIILTNRLDGVYEIDGKIVAECGTRLHKVTKFLNGRGYKGFEFLSGVPATLGGAIRMNASAFGAQTADYIDKIHVLTCNSDNFTVKTVRAEDVHFAYREGYSGIILSAELKKIPKGEDVPDFLKRRMQSQPKGKSLGSTFKNGSVSSGKLIDLCGLKGVKAGGARISEKHANFIINEGGGTASDFLELANTMKSAVYEKYGVNLQEEYIIFSDE